jgi:hypothetical protein
MDKREWETVEKLPALSLQSHLQRFPVQPVRLPYFFLSPQAWDEWVSDRAAENLINPLHVFRFPLPHGHMLRPIGVEQSAALQGPIIYPRTHLTHLTRVRYIDFIRAKAGSGR